MNANEFADELEKAPTLWFKDDIAGKWIIEKLRQQQEQIDKLTAIVALRELKIERMVEKQSHYEAIAHAGGVEEGVRQQQAEIEALKMDIHSLTYGERIAKYFNKPVAWMWEQKINGLARETVFLTYRPWNENAIPLYTHPAKTLTDEEIMVLYEEYIETQYASESNVLGFGRAILRKAQEK
jgi:hypothetical protein